MPTVAFWNLARKRHLNLLVEFINENGVEILAVAEQDFEDNELIAAHTAQTQRGLYAVQFVPSRVRFYSVFPENRFRLLADDDHVSFREYRPTVGLSLLLAGIHLPSKLHRSELEQMSIARRLITRIEEQERAVGHDRTILLGDFNMNPFEPGMVNGDCLHGVMDRRIAARMSRRVSGEERRFFYNPMWKVMGDHSENALGTYYWDRGGFITYYWHTFDQILIRPSLLAAFQEERLNVIDTVGPISLLVDHGPGIDSTVSDHLPILLGLNT